MLDADLIRMAFVLAALSGNIYLSNLAAERAYGTVADTVRLGAYVILWSAAYMWLSALWQQRPVIKELPRMSLSAVTVYVYGLGVLAFVTAYTFLCVSVPCVFNYLVSATCLCACDLVDRTDHPMALRVALALAAVCSLASVICVTLGDVYSQEMIDAVTSGKWRGDDFYGILLPLASPMLYHFTRDSGRLYSPRVVFELIHFAMPFAVILALVTLAMVPASTEAGQGLPTGGQPLWTFPDTTNNGTRLAAPLSKAINSGFTELTAADFAVAVLPLTSVLVLFFAIQSVLLYSTVDFLTAAAFVNAAKFFACQTSEPEAAVGMSLAAIAFMLRVCTSSICDEEPQTLPVYEQSEEEAAGGSSERTEMLERIPEEQ